MYDHHVGVSLNTPVLSVELVNQVAQNHSGYEAILGAVKGLTLRLFDLTNLPGKALSE